MKPFRIASKSFIISSRSRNHHHVLYCSTCIESFLVQKAKIVPYVYTTPPVAASSILSFLRVHFHTFPIATTVLKLPCPEPEFHRLFVILPQTHQLFSATWLVFLLLFVQRQRKHANWTLLIWWRMFEEGFFIVQLGNAFLATPFYDFSHQYLTSLQALPWP